MTDQKLTCPACPAVTGDGLLCRRCVATLRGLLELVGPTEAGLSAPRALPWETGRQEWTGMTDQLRTSLARIGPRYSASMPNLQAVEARDHLQACLATWVIDLELGDGWPEDTLHDMAAWLLLRMERIRSHPASGEIHADLVGAVRRARHAIDSRPDRQFAGRCPICTTGDVYAVDGADEGACTECTEVIGGIKLIRKRMLTAAEDVLATKQEILDALPEGWGVTITDAAFRKWLQRGRLTDRGEREGRSVFRVGDVLDLAHGIAQRRRTG